MSKGMKYCKQHGKFDDCASKVDKAYQAKPKPGDPGFMGHAIKNANKRHRAALRAQKEAMASSNAVHKSAATMAQATQKYNPKNISTEDMRRVGDGMVGAGALAGTAAFVPKKLRPGAALAATAGGAMYAGTKIHQKANQKDEAMSKSADPFGISKGDDGINHLTGTSRVTTSRENRGTGKLVACEYGNRELDGTPRTGRAAGARKIQPKDKAGQSSATSPIGGSVIREQVPGGIKKNSDPFEISKDDGKQVTGGRRVAAQVVPGLHGAVVGKPGKKVRAAANEYGFGTLGHIAGTAAGVGAGLALRKPNIAGPAGMVGGAAGAIAGVQHGVSRNGKKGYYTPIKKNADPFEVEKRDFNVRQRSKLASKGDALPDGKLPIKDKQDLVNAKKLKGKVKGDSPKEVNAYIARKTEELGKRADPFGVEKAFGEVGEAIGQGARMMGGALKGATPKILTKPPVLGGIAGAGAGATLGGPKKVRNAAVGGGLGAAGTMGALKLMKA